MSKDDEEQPDLFNYPHARASDPDTSHEAVPVNLTEQAFLVLHAYASGRPILDHHVGAIVGLPDGHQRCSDLRKAGYIERVARGITPSGKAGYLCRITPAGIAYLKRGLPSG